MPEAGEIMQGRVVGGKFHLGGYLGGTERSAVFLTERQGTPRTAAIKIIPADPASADLQLSRWNLVSRLSHPRLLQIFEVGRCQQDGEELLYVVMEYAEENLAQILPSRSLTPDEVHEMLKPTLEALAYLHGRGFVHGHLKPANIMVAGEQLKLASDGICRIGELDGAETGTYGPPDLAGTAAAPARDVWSLGVTLVQVLTQLLPVRNGNDQRGVTLPETLPPQFVDLVHNCLEADPQKRCTLPEIAEQLHYTLPTTTLGPPPAEPVVAQRQMPPQMRPKPTRKPNYAGRAFAAALAIAAIIGGVKLFNGSPSEPTSTASLIEEPKPSQPAAIAALEQPTLQLPAPAKKQPAAAPAKVQPSARATLKTASEVRNTAPVLSLEPRVIPAAGALVPGSVVQQVLPEVSRSASNTIRGTVRVTVRVRVDPAGNVAGVDFVSVGPSQYFARLASDAAKRWKFAPVRRDGQAVASAWTVRFEFTRGGTRAIPVALP